RARIELNPPRPCSAVARLHQREEPAAARSRSDVLSAHSGNSAVVVSRHYSNHYYSSAVAEDDVAVVEGERLQHRRGFVARRAADVDLRGQNQRIVLTKRRQIIRLVLERDLFELPVAAIDARWNRQLALPDVAIAALTACADACELRWALENRAHEVDARLVVRRLNEDDVLLSA